MYIQNNIYIERLVIEWMVHGKIIVSVDYDSTISPYRSIDNIEDINRCINLVKEAKEVGAYITIFTASDIDRFMDISAYCKSKGITIDSINKTPIDVEFGNFSKIYANIYLDDRAGFIEAMNILEAAMHMVKGLRSFNTETT